MDPNNIEKNEEETEELKRVEEERRKIKEAGLEDASINAFGNITSDDEKDEHKKREDEQKQKKFVGF